ncbi:MAG: hypothetical protein KH423_02345 [Actinomycetaceae bacterium]|nr:hypothetical protein [Actinomycetaceae bacterium]
MAYQGGQSIAAKPPYSPLDPYDFLAALPQVQLRYDGLQLVRLIQEITGAEPFMWGPAIIGFRHGSPECPADCCREEFALGFSIWREKIVIYLRRPSYGSTDFIRRIGAVFRGRSTISFTSLAEVDMAELVRLIETAWEEAK